MRKIILLTVLISLSFLKIGGTNQANDHSRNVPFLDNSSDMPGGPRAPSKDTDNDNTGDNDMNRR